MEKSVNSQQGKNERSILEDEERLQKTEFHSLSLAVDIMRLSSLNSLVPPLLRAKAGVVRHERQHGMCGAWDCSKGMLEAL